MWLVDVDRYVLFENEAGRRERELGERATMHHRRLTLHPDRADRDVTAQLNVLPGRGEGSRAVIDMRLKRSEPPIWLHLSMTTPGAVMGAFGDVPQILLTLFDPARVVPLDPLALAGMFALTPTEAKVAARLAEGASAEEIAVQHAVSVATVRTHIRSLLGKFGARRTVDVVRLLRQGEVLWARAGGPSAS